MNKPLKKAVIREAECIGCTKCIQACPFDAILGSMSLMHTVITDECIGCELCVAPCPVDCIDMVTATEQLEKAARLEQAKIAKQRFQARKNRLEKLRVIPLDEAILRDKKSYIQAAILRAKTKR